MADIESPDVQFDSRGLESRLQAVLESRFAWILAVAIFTLISLLPFWAQRFPPLQDYPQLLLQVHMLETRGDPAYDYDQYYEFDLRPGPYATFYYLTLLLSKFLPIELAGKMFLTFYIGLIALLVLKGARHCRGGRGELAQPRGPPWGLLLLFPFAFNQNYFLGTINYFFSIPLLGLILLDFEDYASARRGIWPAARHTLWQGALFLTHPFTFLLYLGFAGLRTILNYARGRRAWRLAASLLAGSAAFAVWYFLERGSSAADGSPLDQPWVYKPLMWSVGFFSSMFTGMRWNGGIDLAATLLWLVVFPFYGPSNIDIYSLAYPHDVPFATLLKDHLNLNAASTFPTIMAAKATVNSRLAASTCLIRLACLVDTSATRNGPCCQGECLTPMRCPVMLWLVCEICLLLLLLGLPVFKRPDAILAAAFIDEHAREHLESLVDVIPFA